MMYANLDGVYSIHTHPDLVPPGRNFSTRNRKRVFAELVCTDCCYITVEVLAFFMLVLWDVTIA